MLLLTTDGTLYSYGLIARPVRLSPRSRILYLRFEVTNRPKSEQGDKQDQERIRGARTHHGRDAVLVLVDCPPRQDVVHEANNVLQSRTVFEIRNKETKTA